MLVSVFAEILIAPSSSMSNLNARSLLFRIKKAFLFEFETSLIISLSCSSLGQEPSKTARMMSASFMAEIE